MDINSFMRKVEDEFEDLQPNTLQPDDLLREKFVWDSINALIFLAHVNVEYDVEITADELIKTNTIRDLFELVEMKFNSNS